MLFLQASGQEEVKKVVLEVKQFGNDLFKAGKFAPAKRKYRKALRYVLHLELDRLFLLQEAYDGYHCNGLKNTAVLLWTQNINLTSSS